MSKVKLIAVIVLAALSVIVILQNTETVETRFLFASITMPRALLLLVTLLIGGLLGSVITLILAKRKSPAKDE